MSSDPLTSRRIFLINVGVNASHPLESPLFDDGRFEFVPIPESRSLDGPTLVRYGDLCSFYDRDQSLRCYIREEWWEKPAHYDPEFETYTYGDKCNRSPRASALRGVEIGDCLFFLARLVRWHDGQFTDERGFFLIGFLEVAQILRDVLERPPSLDGFRRNAHVRRAQADPSYWDGFWAFKGSPQSRRFQRAVPVTREVCDQVFRDAQGRPWTWHPHQTDLQVIGMYTRTCRCVLDPSDPKEAKRADMLWKIVTSHNPTIT